MIDARAIEVEMYSEIEKSIIIYKEEKELVEKFRETAHSENPGFYL
jgi:hypothetical protein